MTFSRCKTHRVSLWVILLYALCPRPLLAAELEIDRAHIGLEIAEIKIEGNEKTQEKWVLKWANIHPGQRLSLQMMENALRELRDTTLFKQIDFATAIRADGDLLLTITLQEKYYTLLLPRLSRNSDGNIKAGIQLRLDNLQGADRSLRVVVQHEDVSGSDDNTMQAGFRYDWPLFDQPYDLSWQGATSEENLEVDGFQNIVYTDFFLFSATRDWRIEGFKIPWELGAALVFENRDLDRPYPDFIQEGEAGKYNRIRLSIIYDDVHWERYRRYGSFYAATIEQGTELLGSDYDSTISRLETLGFRLLNQYDNLNYRVAFDVANNSPFDVPRFGIGGSSSIRGLEDFDGEGDARFLTNIEYVHGLRSYPLLRFSAFVDLGNVYEDIESFDLTDLQYTVGVGMRWKIESFVDTDLIIDYGYDVENSEGRFYGGTSLLF